MPEPANPVSAAVPAESEPASSFRLALTTACSRQEADRLAYALVERRLAACVNIIEGVASVYRWQGNVEQSPEVLLLIKTDTSCLEMVQQVITELHSYQVPEFLVLTIDSGNPKYLAWLTEALRP